MNHQRFKIAVIGDGNLAASSSNYQLAEELGKSIIDAGWSVITGGLTGIMEAACKGAHQSSRYQYGCTLGLIPSSNPAQANSYADIVIPTGLSHARNTLVAQADAVVAIGGGAGTLAELAFAWIYQRLVIAFNVAGWSGRLAGTRIDDRVRYPSLPDDKVYAVDTAAETINLIKSLLPNYMKCFEKTVS